MTYSHIAGGDVVNAGTINDLIDYGPNMPAAVDAKDSAVTNGTTTSATFVNSLTTSLIRGVSFVAPPSGKVNVLATCGAANGTIAQFTLVSFEVKTGTSVGSGTVQTASDENTASQFQSAVAASNGQHTAAGLVTGLTPGASYNACITYRVTSGTGTFNRRRITVTPVTV